MSHKKRDGQGKVGGVSLAVGSWRKKMVRHGMQCHKERAMYSEKQAKPEGLRS